MKLKRITYQQSYEIVKSVKKDIKPNEGFVKQLFIYESTLNL
jgi:hypothetical protein